MSLQVFLQAHLTGAPEFLTAAAEPGEGQFSDFQGRCAWLNLFCEVLPRALLSELKLSRMLLGSTSAEQFLLVLTEADLPRANDLLQEAAHAVSILSGDTLRLIWASTEDLGAWPVVRKRLDDALSAFSSTPVFSIGADQAFAPITEYQKTVSPYFAQFGSGAASAVTVGWFRSSTLR